MLGDDGTQLQVFDIKNSGTGFDNFENATLSFFMEKATDEMKFRCRNINSRKIFGIWDNKSMVQKKHHSSDLKGIPSLFFSMKFTHKT